MTTYAWRLSSGVSPYRAWWRKRHRTRRLVSRTRCSSGCVAGERRGDARSGGLVGGNAAPGRAVPLFTAYGTLQVRVRRSDMSAQSGTRSAAQIRTSPFRASHAGERAGAQAALCRASPVAQLSSVSAGCDAGDAAVGVFCTAALHRAAAYRRAGATAAQLARRRRVQPPRRHRLRLGSPSGAPATRFRKSTGPRRRSTLGASESGQTQACSDGSGELDMGTRQSSRHGQGREGRVMLLLMRRCFRLFAEQGSLGLFHGKMVSVSLTGTRQSGHRPFSVAAHAAASHSGMCRHGRSTTHGGASRQMTHVGRGGGSGAAAAAALAAAFAGFASGGGTWASASAADASLSFCFALLRFFLLLRADGCAAAASPASCSAVAASAAASASSAGAQLLDVVRSTIHRGAQGTSAHVYSAFS